MITVAYHRLIVRSWELVKCDIIEVVDDVVWSNREILIALWSWYKCFFEAWFEDLF